MVPGLWWLVPRGLAGLVVSAAKGIKAVPKIGLQGPPGVVLVADSVVMAEWGFPGMVDWTALLCYLLLQRRALALRKFLKAPFHGDSHNSVLWLILAVPEVRLTWAAECCLAGVDLPQSVCRD